MNSENIQWQEMKESYLKLIEKNLARVDHPKRSEILANVREHLDRKYAELSPEQQNWEMFQQIITEMGPPEEYAELLMEDHAPKVKTATGINTLLTVGFILVLITVGAHLIFTAQNAPASMETPANTKSVFELDEQVLGHWAAIDFVKKIEDFTPYNRSWKGNLFLTGLDFEPSETVTFSFSTGQHAPNRWSRGEIYYSDERPSRYELRNINGEHYLLMEWISGDVTIRGQQPWYYVFGREE